MQSQQHTTPSTLLTTIADYIGINNRFHAIDTNITIDHHSHIVSPVEWTIQHIWNIDDTGILIGKGDKHIYLDTIIWDEIHSFSWWTYIYRYLSPRNKHYWIAPSTWTCTGVFLHKGKALFSPIIIWCEQILRYIPYLKHANILQSALEKNATASSIRQTKLWPIALIAIGSLNVNHMTLLHTIEQTCTQWSPLGYFSVWSSMIMCLPTWVSPDLSIGKKTKIWEKIY